MGKTRASKRLEMQIEGSVPTREAELDRLRGLLNDVAWGLRNQPEISREEIADVIDRALEQRPEQLVEKARDAIAWLADGCQDDNPTDAYTTATDALAALATALSEAKQELVAQQNMTLMHMKRGDKAEQQLERCEAENTRLIEVHGTLRRERDEALHSVVGKHELEQARAEAFLLKGRVEAAERELERLRKELDAERRGNTLLATELLECQERKERLSKIIDRYDEEARLRKERARGTDPDEMGYA